jgi:hypothetical protein
MPVSIYLGGQLFSLHHEKFHEAKISDIASHFLVKILPRHVSGNFPDFVPLDDFLAP